MSDAPASDVQEVRVEPEGLEGLLGVPPRARGLVIFAHGSGSGRLSPRNNHVAAELRRSGFATFLLDLLGPQEEAERSNVFDIPLLASRLERASAWAAGHSHVGHLPRGYFGASTGAGAALMAASSPGSSIAAVVSRGGRPDLAADSLPLVRAPTLLLVGGLDTAVIEMNQRAYESLVCDKHLVVIEGAGHLFEEPGKLDDVVQHAANWFLEHMTQEAKAG